MAEECRKLVQTEKDRIRLQEFVGFLPIILKN
jgi:hypothetical protein